MTTTRKKLIEVALPLDKINEAAARERSIRHGHPSTLHIWWARKPLAAARAVIFAQMVDDPSSHPEQFPTEEAQEKERQRLFRLIEQLVLWENTTNEEVLQQARDEIWKSWRSTCAGNNAHPRAKELFDPEKLPAFHDPFAGGGALPMEAQRLGLEAYANDLNPVAVLINKAMIEIPPKFAGQPPVSPEARKEKALLSREWRGAGGLAEDVRYYGKWMRDEAEKRIGNWYPDVEVTTQVADERPELKRYVTRRLKVIAWLWARTVKSPNPAFTDVHIPLVRSFDLSTKAGKEAWVQPVLYGDGYRFLVRTGKRAEDSLSGTITRKGGTCLMSGVPVPFEYIRSEGRAGSMGARLMAIVAEADGGRVYLPPPDGFQDPTTGTRPEGPPSVPFFQEALGFRIGNYGLTTWADLFTNRQLIALTTFSDLVAEAREQVVRDTLATAPYGAHNEHVTDDERTAAYANSVALYLAFVVDRLADYWSTLNGWQAQNQQLSHTFARQAISMVWDYAEANPFTNRGGGFGNLFDWTIQSISGLGRYKLGFASQGDAQAQTASSQAIISTDPPYYDNIGYADLSDFFYVWLRRALKPYFPSLLSTIAAPKSEELVATPARHVAQNSQRPSI